MLLRRPHSIWYGSIRAFTALALLLSGCGQATAPAAVPTGGLVVTEVSRPVTAAPGTADPTTAVPAASTATASPTNTTTPAPSPTPPGFSLEKFRPLTAEELASPEIYHDAVTLIAQNWGTEPFDDPQVSYPDPEELWLVKPGLQARARITPEGFNTAIYRSEDGAVKFLSYRTPAEQALAQALGWQEVPAPPECQVPGSPPYRQDFMPCTSPQFTSDGRFLVYFIPPDTCGRKMNIVNVEKNLLIFTLKKGGHWALPLPNGQVLFSSGHCGGGQITHFDPKTGKQTVLGASGRITWNPPKTAFFVNAWAEGGYHVQLWAYNLNTRRLFLNLKPQDLNEFDDTPTWTPDGQAMLYQRMPYFYDRNGGSFFLNHPREIIRVDASTGEQKKVASDYQFNFYLCNSSGATCPVTRWKDDFIPVDKFPFKKQNFFNFIVSDEYIEQSGEGFCAVYGRDCKEPGEELAYNYKTGELVPRSQTALPTQGPPAAAPDEAPHLSAAPLYQDPSGKFKLVDSDPLNCPTPRSGMEAEPIRTLWYVPQAGEGTPFLECGRAFQYLP